MFHLKMERLSSDQLHSHFCQGVLQSFLISALRARLMEHTVFVSDNDSSGEDFTLDLVVLVLHYSRRIAIRPFFQL